MNREQLYRVMVSYFSDNSFERRQALSTASMIRPRKRPLLSQKACDRRLARPSKGHYTFARPWPPAMV